MSNKQIVILCDFDGTIIENDGCDILMDEFGPSGWTVDGELYLARKISHGEMNKRFVANLFGTEKEMGLFVKKKAAIRQGFSEFRTQIQKWNIPFVIISGGWDLYIKAILDSFDLRLLTSKDALSDAILGDQTWVPLISNKVANQSSSKKWQIEPLWNYQGCQLSTPCKGFFAQHLKDVGYKVAIIGNSETDICMAEKADFVFATGSLPKYLDEKQIKYRGFTTFDEVSKMLEALELK